MVNPQTVSGFWYGLTVPFSYLGCNLSSVTWMSPIITLSKDRGRSIIRVLSWKYNYQLFNDFIILVMSQMYTPSENNDLHKATTAIDFATL